MVLILKRQDVEAVLQMSDSIEVLEKAFAELSNGTAVLPFQPPFAGSFSVLSIQPPWLSL